MILYSLRGLRQVFDGRTVLEIERLDLYAGRSYALQGPNGSGKSTLLHILALLQQPAVGVVEFKGKPVIWRERSLHAMRQKVVLVDQHPIMFSTTVLKNVEYGLRMRGMPARTRCRIAEQCLEQVGLQDLARRPAHRLSGGETQRVAIARALACSPEVLLFDEPTASVDVENQAVIESVIREIRSQRAISVIFATHRRLEATRLAEERVFLFDGTISGAGGENVLTGMIEQQRGKVFVRIAASIKLAVHTGLSGRARVFIKPEGIRVIPLPREKPAPIDDCLPGTILQMSIADNGARVLVDVGVFLRATLSREQLVQCGFLVGDRVGVLVDPSAIVVQEQG